MSFADRRFAEFVDETLRQYATSAMFRAALHAEAPNAKPSRAVCPPTHQHGVTNTCYRVHGCRCHDCRAREAARAKTYRSRKAVAHWAQIQEGKAS